MGLEGLHVGGAIAADVAEHLLLGIVHQDVIAQSLFPLEALAAVRTDVWRFRRVLGLMDEQGCPGSEPNPALQAEEGLAQVAGMPAKMPVVLAPLQEAHLTQGAGEMRGLTAAHVLDHLLHRIALEVAANAVVHLAARLHGSGVLQLKMDKVSLTTESRGEKVVLPHLKVALLILKHIFGFLYRILQTQFVISGRYNL